MNKKKICTAMALAMVLTLSSKGFTAMASIEEGAQPDQGSGSITQPISNIQSKKVMISKVTLDQDNVQPGKPFTLTYRIENISGGRIDGLSLKIVNVEGKGTLEPFMPVGTTNEIYVGSIAYGDVKEVSVTLNSAPTLKEGIYNFVTSVMFSQWGNPEEEITKIVGVMAKNPPVMDVSELAWNNGTVTGALYNGGTSKLSNVRAKVTVGEEVFEQNIGIIDVESEEYIEISTPRVEQDTQGNVEIVYEDGTGKEFTTSGTVTIKAVDKAAEEASKIDQQEKLGFWASLWAKIKSFFGVGK